LASRGSIREYTEQRENVKESERRTHGKCFWGPAEGRTGRRKPLVMVNQERFKAIDPRAERSVSLEREGEHSIFWGEEIFFPRG